MRIAFLVGRFPTLSETFVLNQLVGLIEAGHEIDIFAARPHAKIVHEDVERYDLLRRTHYWIQPTLRDAPRVLRRLARALGEPSQLGARVLDTAAVLARSLASRERVALLPHALLARGRGDYDVIYCHFGPMGMRGDVLRQLGALSGKLVTVFHGYDMSTLLVQRGERVYDGLLERGDLFLPISHHWRERLIELGADPREVVVHRMGIDVSRFAFAPRSRAPGEPTQVVQIARFVEKKGLRYGIEAVAKIARARPEAVRYHIVGDGDGDARSRLEALAARLGARDNIIFHGWKRQDEIVDILARAHLLMCPSVTASNGDKEGIPVALMEAMAQGLPVLSTYHSGIPELVEDGVSGYLVNERDAEGLAARLEQLIDHPQQWPAMGAAGRKRVEDEFDIAKLNSRLADLLADLLEGVIRQR